MGEYGTKIDYACADCGAKAVAVPAPWGQKGQQVAVPHALGCPVAARVAAMRARSLAWQMP